MKKIILSGWLFANCFFGGLLLSAQTDAAPQTLSYQQVQEQVVQKNLQLVAAYYDIKIADAQARQAKLWRNPLFVWNQDLYSVELNQYMNLNNQRLIQVEQSFSIAGKHTNTVKLAKMNIELSKLAVADIIRGLLYEASIQYTNLQTLQEKEKLYDFSIQQMEDLLKTVTEQVSKGNIAGNELMRLKTELLDLYTQQDAVKSEMETAAGQLRLLTAMTENTPIRVEPRTRPLAENVNLTTMVELAKESRADYKLRQQKINYEKQNLKLQKSMAAPDINFGYQPHDKGSNYVRPYSGIVLEFSVPLFDRNQGGIQEAQVKIKQAEANLNSQDQQLKQEIATAFNQFNVQKRALNRYSASVLEELETFYKNSQSSYNRRLITLLEFIDQQRIYISTKAQQIELFNGYMQAVNTLNFHTGTPVIE
jgi:outer membrane protein, heavy metal efflux system